MEDQILDLTPEQTRIFMVVAKNDDKVYKKYIENSIRQLGITTVVSTDAVPGTPESIFVKYNSGIDLLVKDNLKPNDAVIFAHEDVNILDVNAIDKIKMIMQEKVDVGMIGVIGTSELPETCAWWHTSPDKMRGHLIQENNGEGGVHLIKGPIGYFDDAVVVDGLFFVIRGSLFLDGLRFDTSYRGFDFYDLDICFEVLSRNMKIAIADILVLHRSTGGNVNEKPNWLDNRKLFKSKWGSKTKFPVTNGQLLINTNIQTVEV